MSRASLGAVLFEHQAMPASSPYDRERGSAHQRGYGARWRRARLIYLASHPLCVMCEQLGRVTAATVVDHKIPHKGDARLFGDATHWQSLCAPCHDSHKQSQERTGIMRGASADGTPIDPAHPWHCRRVERGSNLYN